MLRKSSLLPALLLPVSSLVLAVSVWGLPACAGTELKASAPDPLGDWARDDGISKIKIVPCGDKICATNTWIGDPDCGELVGDTLVLTVKPVSNGELEGEAYDQRRKLTFSMHLFVQPKHLKTSGCLFLGLLCKTAEWTRIDAAAPPEGAQTSSSPAARAVPASPVLAAGTGDSR